MSAMHRVLLTGLSLCLAACAGLREPPVEVDFEYDVTARFEGRNTFAFQVSPESAPRDPRIDGPLFDARVHRATQAVLEERGFVRDVSGEPDYLIAHYGLLDTGVDIQNYVDLNVYGYRTWAQPMRIQQIPLAYDEGMLILDFVDPATHALMWRGYGETRVDLEAASRERAERLRKVVGAMLENFPPRRAAGRSR